MAELRHLFPPGTAQAEQYIYPKLFRRGDFKVPPRDGRRQHALRLIQQIQDAVSSRPAVAHPKGTTLDFQSDPGFKLQLQSLEIRGSGIELLNSRIVDQVMHGTVFIPEGKTGIFLRKFEKYATENTTKGIPRHKALTESITAIRLGALESFWTDAGAFPQEQDTPLWWEVWLRDSTGSNDISAQFRTTASFLGIDVSTHEISFPERQVFLARATIKQWTHFEHLFDILAELRLAKWLTGEFISLSPREQAAWIAEALIRIQPPPDNAPAVCHLDTGVNRGHPLLALALAEEDMLACDPTWTVTDRQGHGTEMAGIALHGCLTTLFATNSVVTLHHRLESVKILPDHGQNAPELYGAITAQAIARAEIMSPARNRLFCLTITADGRDEGLPSSWSGALDSLSAGVDDGYQRLICVSAGNTPLDSRHDYPHHNHVYGVEDPAQAWNALTVGAYTDRAVIQDETYKDWQPLAEPGRLSPSSRTSIVWSDKSWPLKPDIVMEGGNNAVNPLTGRADYVDDLSLLTTRVAPTGALLTTTADTSAATALAARYAAIIYAHYPTLWPETVRGLLVHSARWTDAMLQEFPALERHNRLRCYGFGVPNLERALWSVSNAATLIIEESLQPYEGSGSDIKTKDMHRHELPWPKQILEALGDIQVRMRVTLSYFIEPSPGRRGWTRKHRYQSHGLRFDVKRPLETLEMFRKRLTKAAWEEEEDAIEQGTDERHWELGERLRCKGSIHSDTWSGTAVELAACGTIAVFPVTGWWRERPHLRCANKKARYSLIVTIETPEEDVYTPIANQIGVVISV